MKQTYLFSLLFFISLIGFTQNQNILIDFPGDIAFVAYHDNPDGFSFVLLDECPNNTSIRFVDEEWLGSNFPPLPGEGEVLWTNNTGATISFGTFITIQNTDDNGSGINVNIGTAAEVNTGFTCANGDQIYAITGTTSAPGTFLAFVGEDTSVGDTATLAGTGLTAGTTAIITSSEGIYSDTTAFSTTISDIASKVNDAGNWNTISFTFPNDVPSNFSLSTLSINDFDEAKEIKIFPNPSSDFIQLLELKTVESYKIYNVIGLEVKRGSVSNQELIDIIDLTNGLYILKLENDYSFKFIKD